MKRRIGQYLCCVFIFMLSNTVIATPDKMWVVSEGAKLKTDASASSETITTLIVGEEVFVRTVKKRWVLVFTAAGDNGWIYRGKLTEEKPQADKDDNEEDFFLVEYDKSEIEGEEMLTARSIRGQKSGEDEKNGMSDLSKAYAVSTGVPELYQNELDKVLKFKTGKGEIEDFLEKGEIGEYAP